MTETAVREISAAEVQTLWETGSSACLVDVRERDEWADYHIPNVLLLPMSEFAARCQAELSPQDQVICICEHGVRSERTAQYLVSLGFPDVATMVGGMASYPGPTESGAA